MSDESNTPSMPAQVTSDLTAKKGFLSTAGGKVVAIVVGLGVLGIVAGIAVAIVFVVFGGQVVDEALDQVEQQVTESSESATSTVTAQAEAPADEVANASVFTFRDIFVPLLEPLEEATADAVTTTSTVDTVTSTADDTLYLDGVVTENGVLVAQLRYNGTSYSLAAGGSIPDSPWQVLRVSSTSVTMLYGDIQVTLAVGEGVTK